MVRYDRLGTSNSDPLPSNWDPSPAAFERELEAVLDAAGRTDEMVLMSWLDAGPFAIQYAAANPDRVDKLILYNTTARFLEADDYDIGLSADWFDALMTHIDTLWGTDAQVELNVPSRLGDARFAMWYAKLVRSLGTPTTIVEILRNNLTLDVRSKLSELHMPTLVMHRAEYGLIPVSHGRYLAEHIDGAEFVELPGADGPMFWEASDLILGHIRSFIGRDAGAPAQRQFATILFSDIVRSTEMAESLGDRAWSAVIGVHRTIADEVVEAQRGRLVKSTGDGILAVFPDPASALEGAVELRAKLDEIGVTVRVGLHSGRIEVADDNDVSGVAVHIAARVMAAADDGEIVVSRTVRDLMLGADTKFRDLGPHGLKGVDGEWDLYALESG